jgi:hypothetical protein
MEEGRKKAGIELKPSLKKRLKALANETDRPMWQVVEEAITIYLDGAKREPEDDPDVAKVRFILDRGSDRRVSDFRGNVELFYDDAKRNPRASDRPRPKRKVG